MTSLASTVDAPDPVPTTVVAALAQPIALTASSAPADGLLYTSTNQFASIEDLTQGAIMNLKRRQLGSSMSLVSLIVMILPTTQPLC